MELAILNLLTFIIDLAVINFFFASSNKGTKIYSILLVPLVITSFLINLFLPKDILPVWNIILQFLAIVALTRLKRIPLQKSFFMIATLLTIFLVTDVLATAILFGLIPSDLSESSSLIFHIYGNAIAIILNIVFVTVFKLLVFEKSSSSKRAFRIPLLIALSSIPLVSVLVLCIFSLITIGIIPTSNSLWIVIIISVIYMNLCILYLYFEMQIYFEKLFYIRIQNKEFESELKTFKEVKKSQSQIRSINHDLKNRFLIILSFLEQNNISLAKEYLTEAVEKIDSTSQQFYTHNYTLNYLLNEKRKIAENAGALFNISILFPKKTTIDNNFIAVVLGNLMDNALNAVSRLPELEKKEIRLTIKLFNRNLMIELSNSFDPKEVDSRKHRKIQGIGIKNIKAVVEENGGIYEHWVNDSIYTVSIVLLNINIGDEEL